MPGNDTDISLPAVPPQTADSIYTKEELADEFRQAELVSDLTLYSYNSVTTKVQGTLFPFAVIMTQDCDLLQDFNIRRDNKESDLLQVLVYPAEDIANARANFASDLWRRIKTNKNERFHVLEAVPPEHDLEGAGLPSLLIDFKRYFTIHVEEIERQAAAKARRRTRLVMPYREHLQARASFYVARVGLPRQHNV